MPRSKKTADRTRSDVIRSTTTPLGFFVFTLLVVEVMSGIVLTWSNLSEEHVWHGFLWMMGVFVGVILVVTLFTIGNPRNLLYGKEEHLAPQLEPSALRDQIEDLIHSNVKPDALLDSQPK